jgi:uncharacterized protein YkwD
VDPADLDAVERQALARCGQAEAGLRDVARSLLARKIEGGALPELDGLAQELRAAGEPHPWPRAWSARGRSLDDPASLGATMARLGTWLGDSPDPLRRCGVASGVGPDGTRTIVVIAAEGLADLAPLPMRARTGQWMTLEAHLRVAARGATVVVLDPAGAPRTIPCSLVDGVVRARFAAQRPGEVAVQVVADVAGGPRPVIEASVFVDIEPSASPEDREAPGESASLASAEGSDADSLTRMIAGARASVGLGPVVRDARLDGLALEHARHMARMHELAHDAGDGDPLARMRAAGLEPSAAGENVAHASSLRLAHRALWQSPSHRLNLLGRSFDRVGVGVVRDEQGGAWVAETFAAGL